MKPEKPEWLPDWRDESAYRSTGKWINRKWAWEFPRRNPEYRGDHAQYCELIETAAEEFKKIPGALLGRHFFDFDPPLVAGETYRELVS